MVKMDTKTAICQQATQSRLVLYVLYVQRTLLILVSLFAIKTEVILLLISCIQNFRYTGSKPNKIRVYLHSNSVLKKYALVINPRNDSDGLFGSVLQINSGVTRINSNTFILIVKVYIYIKNKL